MKKKDDRLRGMHISISMAEANVDGLRYLAGNITEIIPRWRHLTTFIVELIEKPILHSSLNPESDRTSRLETDKILIRPFNFGSELEKLLPPQSCKEVMVDVWQFNESASDVDLKSFSRMGNRDYLGYGDLRIGP